MMKNFGLIFAILLLFHLQYANAQNNESSINDEKFRHNQIGALLAHTHMRTGDANASKTRLSVPSFTLFYNYHFNEKWFLGLHTDFVTEDFVAKSLNGEGNSIQRKTPIAPAIMFGFKPGKHFSFLLGGGADIDKDETLGLVRMDVEYGLEITNGWEFVTALGYDIRIKSYGSFQFGVGMSKNF